MAARYRPWSHLRPFCWRQRWGCAALLASVSISACGADDGPAKSSQSDLGGLKIVRDDPTSQPLSGVSTELNARFNTGDSLFEHVYFESQGLGPVYIRAACASCHAGDARGPGNVQKRVLVDDDGTPLPDQTRLPWGNTIRPQFISSASETSDEPLDLGRLLVTTRQPPAVYGRGYMEAISDSEIQRVEQEQSTRDDGVSGRINWVTYNSDPNPEQTAHRSYERGEVVIGRFGLKARIASLDDFTADAFQGDMGLTSDMRPEELPNPIGDTDDLPGIDLAPDTINAVADYMRLLRIPRRELSDVPRGPELFSQARCDVCHVPALHTDPDYPIDKLADIDAPIYSDLLLHDMGPDFADGLNDYGAGSSEWRTPPLIGLRHLRNYLHDGRAKTLEEAIHAHGAQGSEAASSVSAFVQLDDEARTDLLNFVSAL